MNDDNSQNPNKQSGASGSFKVFVPEEAPPPPPPGQVAHKSVTKEGNYGSESISTPNPEQQFVSVNTQGEKSDTVLAPQVQGSDAQPPSPRKKFPVKIIFFVAIGIVVFVAFIMLFQKIFKKEATTGSQTITWWGLWEDESTVKPLIEDFKKSHPGVEIKYIKNSPSDYRERLVSALAKGGGPDIFAFHNTWTATLTKELENVPSSFASASEFTQTFFPVVASDAAMGTGLLGVPYGYDAITLYINENLFSSAQKQPPTTWNELRETAKALTQIENDQIKVSGVALGRVENVDHWQEIVGLMVIQNGVNLTAPGGKLLEDALTYFTLFSTVDKVWDETLPNSTTMFASGRLAMYFGPSWRSFEIKSANPDLKFRTVPLPQLPKERSSDPNVSYATYWLNGVSVKSEVKDISWEFLKYLTSTSSLETLFQNASLTRSFGEIYPRVDMKEKLVDHPVLGSIVKLAPEAKSWYLASRTHDGQNGINTQVSKHFEDSINLILEGKNPEEATENLTSGVTSVLAQYGLVKN